MAKKHTLDLYAHLDGPSCFGCVETDVEEAPPVEAGTSSDAAAPPAPPPASAGPETAPLPEEEKDPKPLGWLEVALVDDADEPVANVKLEIKLADGNVRNVQTDAKGVIRLARIPPGNCEVKFVELDDRLVTAM